MIAGARAAVTVPAPWSAVDVLPTAVFAARFAHPFLDRRLVAYDPAIDSHVCTRPLEVAVRAGLVLGGTAFVGMLTLVTTSARLATALHASVEMAPVEMAPVEMVMGVLRVAVLVAAVAVARAACARRRTLAPRRAQTRGAGGGRGEARDATMAGDRVAG